MWKASHQAPLVESCIDVVQRFVQVLSTHLLSIRIRTSCGGHWLMGRSQAHQVAVFMLRGFERQECDFASVYRLYLADALSDRAFRVMMSRHCVVLPL